MAGHSGTPLWRELGIRHGMTVALFNAPPHLETLLEGHPDGVRFVTSHPGTPDMVICFAVERDHLADLFEAARRIIPASGAIWAAWPRPSSGIPTELGPYVVREMLHSEGLVDVEICAIDETWSALEFVVRKERRETWGR